MVTSAAVIQIFPHSSFPVKATTYKGVGSYLRSALPGRTEPGPVGEFFLEERFPFESG